MEIVMFLGKPVMAIAAAALCLGGGAVSASAQQSCAAYYNQVMAAYQSPGPGSPQYNQMASDYSARCLSGAAAAPNPGYYQAPYTYSQYQAPYAYPQYQAPYAYSQPVAVDPVDAIVGAAIVGSALGGAYDNDRYDHRDYGRRW
jgi:hypothetical protein